MSASRRSSSRRASYSRRRHDIATGGRHGTGLDKPGRRPGDPDTDYLGRPIAPETALEQRARDGDR